MEEVIVIDDYGNVSYYDNKDEYGGTIQYDNGVTAKHTVYSDRLFSWDYKKYDECCQKVWNNKGQEFYRDRKEEDIQKFLRLYTEDDSLTLCRVVRYKRMDGYSVWRFDYNTNKTA